jgi:hypothetical protein
MRRRLHRAPPGARLAPRRRQPLRRACGVPAAATLPGAARAARSTHPLSYFLLLLLRRRV